MELTVWLRVQLDEDERVARAAGGGRWVEHNGNVVSAPLAAGDYGPRGYWVAGASFACEGEAEGLDEGHAAHIARHDPARVLAEVMAKRLILDGHDGVHRCAWGDYALPEECRMARLLALPYADREGYDESWRPNAG